MARVLLALFIAGAAVAGGLTLYIVWPSLPWTDDGHPGRSAPLHAPELGASQVVLYVPGLEFDRGLKARRFMIDFLSELIDEKRGGQAESHALSVRLVLRIHGFLRKVLVCV